MPRADRPRHGILRKPRAPRVRALSRSRGCGPLPNQDQEPANQWNRRALPQNSAERVLPGGVPQAHLRLIAELQEDLDEWIRSYNENRPHQGRWCFGKTPIQTFLDATPLAR